MGLTSQKILRTIEANAPAIRRYGVRSLALFGSHALGTAREESDLDFVADFETKSFDAYMDFLEGLFARRVDLALKDALKPRLRATILNQALDAPGL